MVDGGISAPMSHEDITDLDATHSSMRCRKFVHFCSDHYHEITMKPHALPYDCPAHTRNNQRANNNLYVGHPVGPGGPYDGDSAFPFNTATVLPS